MRRRLRNFAILTLLSLVLLEVVLQVGALAIAWTHGSSASSTASDGRRVVMCVGDSFTYGLGASSRETGAYPSQLQQQLDATEPGRWHVANEGLPGRNSRGVLERIDAQLRAHRPEFVAILAGLNDRWSQPARLDLTAEPSAAQDARAGFRLEWRTRRFCLWLLGRLREDGAPQGSSGPQLGGVEPFAPQLAADDRWRVADAARRQPAEIEDESTLAERLDALGVAATGASLPLLRAGARQLASTDPRRALTAAVRAFAWTGNRERFTEELQTAGARFDPELLDRVARALDLSRGTWEAIAQAFADALGWRQGDGLWIHEATGASVVLVEPRWVAGGEELVRIFEVHRFHLTQVVERCRAAGAVPLLLGYPNRVSVPDVIFERIAAETGTPFLSTVETFEQRLGGRDPSALFVADGHCNDAGYAVVAEIVREFVAKR